MKQRGPCALPALGLVSCLGSGAEAHAAALARGDQSHFSEREFAPGKRMRVGVVREPLPSVPASLAPWACRTSQLLLAAAAQIELQVAEACARFGALRVGVVLGTSTAGSLEAERAFRERGGAGPLPDWFDLRMFEPGGAAQMLAHALSLGGPRFAHSSACSSGAKALASARELILGGWCDAVVVGGVDSLCDQTARGFDALQAVSLSLTNPMSRNRDGLTLGEGAAVFLMTRERAGICLLGSGEAMDGHHISAPDPEGRGAEAAMRAALADAGVDASEIAYLNLHGTGTPHNDAMEARAVSRALGSAIPCSSTKPLVGHTLAAAGAIEAAFCWLLLQGFERGDRALPPHRFDGEEDPALPRLHLVRDGERAAAAARSPLLSTSFGFGGSNAALVLGVGR